MICPAFDCGLSEPHDLDDNPLIWSHQLTDLKFVYRSFAEDAVVLHDHPNDVRLLVDERGDARRLSSQRRIGLVTFIVRPWSCRAQATAANIFTCLLRYDQTPFCGGCHFMSDQIGPGRI